jgi:hypothetical protein
MAGCFIVQDATGQNVAWFHFHDDATVAPLLKERVRRSAVNFAGPLLQKADPICDQRAEAINCARQYPPKMTAAKLPATTARRKAAVTAYSMGNPSKRRAPLPRQEG